MSVSFGIDSFVPCSDSFSIVIVGLACAPIVETRFLELAMSLLDFSPQILLGTFSILPWTKKKTHSILLYTCIVSFIWLRLHSGHLETRLTDKEGLVSELTRSDSWALDTSWNSLCVYNVGRQARSSDCIDTVLSVFKFIINIDCL